MLVVLLRRDVLDVIAACPAWFLLSLALGLPLPGCARGTRLSAGTGTLVAIAGVKPQVLERFFACRSREAER
jgi:hypothetical protein